jgi:2-dehydro-3-deoxy-D-arabinonate dehydratase
MFIGCCALGPVIVTADELQDPYSLEMTCTVTRGEETVFEGRTSTSQLNRKIEELVEFLLRANPVPGGSVVLTGTGIIAPQTAALNPGDIVSISVPEIGTLSNPAAFVA